MQKRVKFHPLGVKNAESLVSWYCQKGGNDLPHWRFLDKERAKFIFNSVLPKLKSELLARKCEEIISELNK